ncbi:hypothetical protein CDAR_93301 [Caerostris darwini]|uniref:Uncharacterized protein n=1 Tax=Caerostris darwini TaxID=1538125 RepID=A0AAV4UXG6_9ARAC|nr:hypothetical protein CDAR_93301 [Caerostris darwini]
MPRLCYNVIRRIDRFSAVLHVIAISIGNPHNGQIPSEAKPMWWRCAFRQLRPIVSAFQVHRYKYHVVTYTTSSDILKTIGNIFGVNSLELAGGIKTQSWNSGPSPSYLLNWHKRDIEAPIENDDLNSGLNNKCLVRSFRNETVLYLRL